jgi:hypothetical protein
MTKTSRFEKKNLKNKIKGNEILSCKSTLTCFEKIHEFQV